MPHIGISVVNKLRGKRSIKENAKERRQELINNPTRAERIFKVIAENCGINLEFQKVIYKYRKGKRVSYAIPDYTDNERKIIFELDGAHHYNNSETREHDYQRDLWLTNEKRYTIYRIPNDLVVEETNKLFKDIYNI